jgi:arylsulfatase A
LLVDAKSGYVSGRNKTWEAKHEYPGDNDEPVELYDLSNDIGQRNNVASENPEQVARMQGQLAKIRKQGYSAPRLAK